ncbi:YciI family protein [Luteococcus peritonei]|uniref:YciI family protein n=1 Tax=Luteococcus peritonei TaxID=88874 RepID=A0ABW4RV95_9ACTN
MANLFVLDLTYVADVELVDEHMEAHRAHLRRHYANGTFLASGRKEPRTGGIVLARGERADIEAVVESDPFTVHGVTRCTITEFIPTMTAHALQDYRVDNPA